MDKKRIFYHCLCLILLLSVFGCAERVKEPAVAGSFYPADEKTLKETVDNLLAHAEDQTVHGRLIALISPHAGYVYSGQIAAFTYRHLKERDIDTVILIGASHHKTYQGASVYARGGMKTPLGLVKINEKMAQSLLDEKAQVTFSAEPFEKEHSLEVQLPFLQATLKDFRIVPILMGSPTPESFTYLSDKLTAILRGNPKAIIIASTDLSHYHDYETAGQKDMKIIDAIRRMSVEDAEQLLRTGDGEMCGGYPVLLTMLVARNLGATDAMLYKYANSGDVTADKSRVVGYASMGLYQTELTAEERRELLGLARQTIQSYVKSAIIPDIKPEDPRLRANGATFVTINRVGQLRGCIGNILPIMPLYRSVITNAVSASSRDPRFPPMTDKELADIEVEVTVLSPLEPLRDAEDIVIGKHGLYVTNGQSSGILLPQVAVEQNWNTRAFLENVSLKAGLHRDAWKTSKLFIFTADIIR
ncbi:MAG: AmmeMemoRadiSam system protein B [Nitrospirae bacterium]|nr:AmmeMemoRadiSam system protein B [Nitrospirota bacterium]